jgi:hypothetical protein
VPGVAPRHVGYDYMNSCVVHDQTLTGCTGSVMGCTQKDGKGKEGKGEMLPKNPTPAEGGVRSAELGAAEREKCKFCGLQCRIAHGVLGEAGKFVVKWAGEKYQMPEKDK